MTELILVYRQDQPEHIVLVTVCGGGVSMKFFKNHVVRSRVHIIARYVERLFTASREVQEKE